MRHYHMPTLNLSANHLAQVMEILQQHVPQCEVWAYGSRVNGNAHSASDLDLVIRNPESLTTPIPNLAQVKQAFIESNLPVLVDVMDWACLPESYCIEINKQHIKCYSPGTSS